ncbi:hypothetical protein HA075_18900 [bacterium BFN5]|nr:hypothetical protein HA075_18900 [bacterium BFN5]
MTNLEMIYATKNLLWSQLYTSWITEELFSFPWWFSVVSLIISYIIWWKLLDKSRLVELLLFGSLVAVMSIIIDTVADNLTLWQYKVKIFPFTPGFFPYHLSLAPLMLMLVYQYTNHWRSYVISTVFAGLIYCFVMIPTFVFIGEAQLYKWNHGYTFITFTARAMIGRWILMLCKHIQSSYQDQKEDFQSTWLMSQPVLKVPPDNEAEKGSRSDE